MDKTKQTKCGSTHKVKKMTNFISNKYKIIICINKSRQKTIFTKLYQIKLSFFFLKFLV